MKIGKVLIPLVLISALLGAYGVLSQYRLGHDNLQQINLKMEEPSYHKIMEEEVKKLPKDIFSLDFTGKFNSLVGMCALTFMQAYSYTSHQLNRKELNDELVELFINLMSYNHNLTVNCDLPETMTKFIKYRNTKGKSFTQEQELALVNVTIMFDDVKKYMNSQENEKQKYFHKIKDQLKESRKERVIEILKTFK